MSIYMVGVPITNEHLEEGERKGKAAESWNGAQPQLSTPSCPTAHGATEQQHGGRHSRRALHPCTYTYGCIKIYMSIYVCVLCRHNDSSFVLQAAREEQAGNVTASAAELDLEKEGRWLGVKTHQP